MIAVIDTNIFMAALLNPSGAPAKIRRRWRQRQFEILISEAVLHEYTDVFIHAPAIAAIEAQLLMDEIEAFSRRVEISGTLQACKDPDDDVFLETAVTGGADFLVTKNLICRDSAQRNVCRLLHPVVVSFSGMMPNAVFLSFIFLS
jgi:putative PIN family toxin of toxin-antitoxin system